MKAAKEVISTGHTTENSTHFSHSLIEAYKTSWGLKVPGVERGRLLSKLADLVEANIDELAALESLNIGMKLHVHTYPVSPD